MRGGVLRSLILGVSLLSSCVSASVEGLPGRFDFEVDRAKYYVDEELFEIRGKSLQFPRPMILGVYGSDAECFRNKEINRGDKLSLRFDNLRRYIRVESQDGVFLNCSSLLEVY